MNQPQVYSSLGSDQTANSVQPRSSPGTWGTLTVGGKGGDCAIIDPSSGRSRASFLFADNVLIFDEHRPDGIIRSFAALNPYHFGQAVASTVESLINHNTTAAPSADFDQALTASLQPGMHSKDVLYSTQDDCFSKYGTADFKPNDPDWRKTIDITYRPGGRGEEHKLVVLPRSEYETNDQFDHSVDAVNEALKAKMLRSASAKRGRNPAFLIDSCTPTTATTSGPMYSKKAQGGFTLLHPPQTTSMWPDDGAVLPTEG